jgi:hypothetical protein
VIHSPPGAGTLALDEVVVTPELVAALKEHMTRCSQFVASSPQGASASRPGRQELAADLAKLREF